MMDFGENRETVGQTGETPARGLFVVVSLEPDGDRRARRIDEPPHGRWAMTCDLTREEAIAWAEDMVRDGRAMEAHVMRKESVHRREFAVRSEDLTRARPDHGPMYPGGLVRPEAVSGVFGRLGGEEKVGAVDASEGKYALERAAADAPSSEEIARNEDFQTGVREPLSARNLNRDLDKRDPL